MLISTRARSPQGSGPSAPGERPTALCHGVGVSAPRLTVRFPWEWVGAAVVLAWLVLITVLTAQDADSDGASTPAELADRATNAVHSSDAGSFADLLADPLTADTDFAQSYLDALGAKGAANVTLIADSPGRVEIQGRGGTPFTYPLKIDNTDGRWYLSFLPL